MDARSPAPDPATPPSPPPSAASAPATGLPSDPSEHADSPMRKRPRLGSNRDDLVHDMADDGQPPHTAAPGPQLNGSRPHYDSPPLPQTPSKVTLNLRPAASQHSPESPSAAATTTTTTTPHMSNPQSNDTLSSDSTDSLNGRASPEPGFVDITAGSPVSSVESPVVEIEVDGPDDVDEGSVVDVASEDPWFVDEAHQMEDFPFAGEYGIPDAANFVANNMAEGVVTIDELSQLGLWEDDWINLTTRLHPNKITQLYFKRPEFWVQLAQIHWKFLNRRTTFGTWPPRTEDERYRALRSFFHGYHLIFCQIITIDCGNLEHPALEPDYFPDLLSPRHIKNVDAVFRPIDEVAMLKVLSERYRVDILRLQRDLAIALTKSSPQGIASLMQFIGTMAQNFHERPSLSSNLLMSLRILRNLIAHARICLTKEIRETADPQMSKLTQQAMHVAWDLEPELKRNIAKQKSSLSADDSVTLAEECGSIIEDAAALNSPLAEHIFELRIHDGTTFDSENCPRMLRNTFVLHLLWHFILKGRMELRVNAVNRLSAILVEAWREYNSETLSSQHVVLQSIGDWLVEQKVVQYIVGVDSHPQIISRSRDVIGFLMVTQRWSQDLTDVIWENIDASQDPRIVAAILVILGGIVPLANPPELADFCGKVGELSLRHWTASMDQFVRHLLEQFKLKEHRLDETTRSAPLNLCIKIIEEAMASSSAESDIAFRTAATSLKSFTGLWVDAEARRKLYVESIEEIKQSPVAVGRVHAIRTLSASFGHDDVQYLATELSLIQILSEQMCNLVDLCKQSASGPKDIQRLTLYLELWSILVVIVPDYHIDSSLEARLWSHLFGQEAINNMARDIAWSQLCSISRGSKTNHPMIERTIEEYLATLSPQATTTGVFEFVQAAVDYRQRVSPVTISLEDETVEIPLSGFIWNIILSAPDESLRVHATAFFSRLHLDGPLIRKASRASIAATHTALVENCIQELQELASLSQGVSTNRDLLHDTPNKILPSSREKLHTQRTRFSRTIHLLRQFLHEIRRRPFFLDAQSPLSQHMSLPYEKKPLQGEPLALKYQAFDGGSQREVQEIQVGSDETFSDLFHELCQVTGFSKFSVIQCGRQFDLLEEPNTPTKNLHDKGLLLIRRKRESGNISPPRRTSHHQCSVAEKVLLSNFDKLYGFLELEDELSVQIYDLLGDLPPHDRIRQLIMSGDQSLPELFPQHNRIKTLYSLRSLKALLERQTHSGMVDEKFVIKAVQALTNVLIQPHHSPPSSIEVLDQPVLSALVDCLLVFLKERPLQESLGDSLAESHAIVDRLFALIEALRKSKQSVFILEPSLVYSALIECSLHSREIWVASTEQPNLEPIYYWLLTKNSSPMACEHVQKCIDNVCRPLPSKSAVQAYEFAAFFWQTLSGLIPIASADTTSSAHLLSACHAAFLHHETLHHDEAALWSLVTESRTLLTQHNHREIPGQNTKNHFLYGIARLISSALSSLKSFKKPIKDPDMIQLLSEKFLFPTSTWSTNEGNELYASCTNVLDTDTRRELYHIIMSLSDDLVDVQGIASRLLELVSPEAEGTLLPWLCDKTRLLRSSAGYGGLRNLTNTCYMNSLITQLFMNTNFRNFIMTLPTSEDRNSSKLLEEIQSLFTRMQSSSHRFADTGPLTSTIRPFDSDYIDINVQMDVDEFYALLFDRLEDQMPDSDAKRKLSSFYGGQSVTQTKSMDCEHVSEKVATFKAVQCDVRGKASLQQSLTAFCEGDVMEGDNKYKCESCDGRFVNAVRRDCLKDIPDNLIFHLKRFDFDLNTLQRVKINDYFEFPSSIDMQPYKLDYLSAETPDGSEDWFELTGVLVHNGTAETGHYYSYIRSPLGSQPGDWIEFNDTEVTEFDPSKIPDQCFGGTWEAQDGSVHFPKCYSAYMLFYRRIAAPQSDKAVVPRVPGDTALKDQVAEENRDLVNCYCLMDDSHVAFLKMLLRLLKNATHGGQCTDNHTGESQILSLVLNHLTLIYARSKESTDVEQLIDALKNVVSIGSGSGCAKCCSAIMQWVLKNEDIAHEVLLQCPLSDTRSAVSKLIVSSVSELRIIDPGSYGFDPATIKVLNIDLDHLDGFLVEFVKSLRRATCKLAKALRTWDEFFQLWASLVNLGPVECALLMHSGAFQDCLELVMLDREVSHLVQDHIFENLNILTRIKRRVSYRGILEAIWAFFQHVNFRAKPVGLSRSRIECFDEQWVQFPMTKEEWRWVFYQDKDKGQMKFLARLFDIMDNDEDLCHPARVIRLMLDDESQDNLPDNISQTIAKTIDAYWPDCVGLLLTTAISFCRVCPEPRKASPVIKAAAKSAAQLEVKPGVKKSAIGTFIDYATQNGARHLEFFQTVAEMTDVFGCMNAAETVYLIPVLVHAKLWIPPLLAYEERELREATRRYLDVLIFNEYPILEEPEGGRMPSRADVYRAKAVRDIFPECWRNVVKNFENRIPKLVAQPSIDVLFECAKWVDRLTKEDSHLYDKLRHVDDELILQQFFEYRERLSRWHDVEGDEAMTETEWNSNFEDDDSDEVTEM